MKRAFHKKNIVEYPYLGMYDSFVTIMCNIYSCKIPKTKNVCTIANTFDDVQNIVGLNTPLFNGVYIFGNRHYVNMLHHFTSYFLTKFRKPFHSSPSYCRHFDGSHSLSSINLDRVHRDTCPFPP